MDNLFSGQKFDFIGEGYALKKTSDKDIVHLYKNGILIKRVLHGKMWRTTSRHIQGFIWRMEWIVR